MSIKHYIQSQEKFRKILDENPNLPIMFLVGEDCCPESGFLSCCLGNVEVEDLCDYNEKLLKREDLQDEIYYVLDKQNLEEELTDEEFNAKLKEVEESIEFAKCIVIRMGQ